MIHLKKVPLALVGALVLGCPAEDPEDSQETSNANDTEEADTFDSMSGGTFMPTSGVDTTQPGESTTGPATTTDDPTSADTGGSDEGGFISEPDGGGVAVECDVWTDDCPEGEKCMPWANDGGNSWNATKCSPLDPNPAQPGDDCMVEGSGVSGVDNCDARAMCYYVDPETGTGTCVGFCDGTPDNPVCDPGYICTIVNDGVLTLCRPECDPLLQDCPDGAACYQANGADGFTCIVDASGEGGVAGDPCEFINSCDPGLFCAAAEAVPDCGGAAGCCSEFCDLTDPDPVSYCSLGGGQDCVAWFEEGSAPPDLEHVGVCAIPQ